MFNWIDVFLKEWSPNLGSIGKLRSYQRDVAKDFSWWRHCWMMQMCDGGDLVFCRLWRLSLIYGETRIDRMISVFQGLFIDYMRIWVVH